MIKKGISFVAAESCTGGMLSKLITDKSGSSRYFKGSFVVYSNEMKVKTGLVEKDILKKYGAVSMETAESMSRNASKKMLSKASIAITGIAGPGGGTKLKKKGVVFISTNYKGKTETEECNFKGSRDNIRKFSVYYSMFYLLRRINNE